MKSPQTKVCGLSCFSNCGETITFSQEAHKKKTKSKYKKEPKCLSYPGSDCH
jgi:hypothetical protein